MRTFSILIFLVLFAFNNVNAQVGTICKWDGDKKAAVVLTFDDWSPGQYPIAVFDLKNRGLTGTFFPIGSIIASWNHDWPTLVESAGYGHEFGNHTQTHPDLTTVSSSQLVTEIEGMKNLLDQHITSQKCLTLAYPGCTYNQTVINELKSSGHIGARACGSPNFSWNFISTEDDYYKIGTYGMSNSVSLSTFQSQVNSVISGGGLLTFMYHSLDDGSTYGDNWFAQVQQSNFDAQLDYLVSVNNTVWVTTFTNAIKYHREVLAATLSEVSAYNASTWVIKLTHTLNSSLYNLPLSIRLNTNGVNYTSVSQNGSSITIDSNSGGVIMFRAIPNGGNITLSSSGGGCTPTAISPYIQVDGGTWSQTSSVTVNSGSTIILGPQSGSGGSWSWTGCGTSGTSREQTFIASSTCTATATYTNTSGCNSTQDFTITVNAGSIAVTGVTLSPTTASISVGGTSQLTETVSPSNATNKTVSWTSSNTSVATVSSSGLVTGVAAGSATITVTTQDGGKTATCAVTVTASSGIVSGGTYEIIARHSGKAIGIKSASTANNAATEQETYTGLASQKFVITDLGTGYYSISPSSITSKALDVKSKSTADGASIIQYTYSGANNQQWQLISDGSGYYQIKSRLSGKCMDVSGSSTADGASVVQWTCGTGTNQQFSLARITSKASATATEISEVEPQEEIQIFPNPSDGNFKIASAKDARLWIYSVNGKLVYSRILNDEITDISSKLESGAYIIRLEENGNVSSSKLFIK